MDTSESKISLLYPDQRRLAIEEIINFFKAERDQEIGVVAAEEILDLFLDGFAKTVYNKGVKDARAMLEARISDFGIDLEGLLLDE